MSRELVKSGDTEPLEFEWLMNGGTVATSVEVRAYIVEADGTKLFWNGAAFAAPDAQLTGTLAAGVWRKNDWTWPAAGAGKEVFIEAKPTAPAALAAHVIVESRRVVTYLPDDVHAAVQDVDADLASARTALQAEHDATQVLVLDLDSDVAAARAALQAEHDATQLLVLDLDADVAAARAALQAEHDATQALIVGDGDVTQAAIAALQAQVGTSADAAADPGTLHAKASKTLQEINDGETLTIERAG